MYIGICMYYKCIIPILLFLKYILWHALWACRTGPTNFCAHEHSAPALCAHLSVKILKTEWYPSPADTRSDLRTLKKETPIFTHTCAPWATAHHPLRRGDRVPKQKLKGDLPAEARLLVKGAGKAWRHHMTQLMDMGRSIWSALCFNLWHPLTLRGCSATGVEESHHAAHAFMRCSMWLPP